MHRRSSLLVLVAVAAMLTVAALSQQKKADLLLLDWARRGAKEPPPVAVLIEWGLKDKEPSKWSGRAAVRGARVLHREGYRFREGDKLLDKDGWEMSSHRGLRVPPRNPAIGRMEGIATIGVVLHLADVKDDAALTLEPAKEGDARATVALKGVLSGQPQSVWDGNAQVRLVTTALPLTAGKTEDDSPAAAYGPDGILWAAYISYHLRHEDRRIEQPDLKGQPANFKSLYIPEFADQLFVKYYRDGKWSDPIAITGAKEDLVRCAIGVEGSGDVWVVYSAQRQGQHHLYARPIRKAEGGAVQPGAEQQLTRGEGRHLSPLMCTDESGDLRVSYQTWGADGVARLGLFTCRKGEWLPGIPGQVAKYAFGGDGNNWGASITSGPGSEVVVAYDCYEKGDYDVGLHTETKTPTTIKAANSRAAATARFEARPSACYDGKGRLWVAYEEGPEGWGHDYGSLAGNAEPLYSSRSVRVVCLDQGQLLRPVAELPTSMVKAPTAGEPQTTQGFEKATRYAYPRLGLDGKGRLWLTYRQKFGSRYSSHPGSYWLSYARCLEGDKWSEPIEVHHSDGLLDYRPVLLPHASGGLVIVHNTDGRYTTPEKVQNLLYTSYLSLPGEPVEPKLVPHERGSKDDKGYQKEKEAVQHMRSYRLEAAGKKYQLVRGEFHRHCEISWDGGADGSLEDLYRYALDAGALDWIGDGDHDNGTGREYSWWLVQKYTDAYTVKDHFTPLFGYERSVPYPHGHRNVLFAQRGVLTLPRLAEADPDKRVAGIHADDTKMLYRYLKEFDGICAAHTSATGMGTDWRDNDPQVEPFVEIYQGDRNSYEMEEAPRAGYDPKSGKKPANIAGWFPKGYVNLALAKGYRLGFESSSDHWSTHISYAVVLAEKHDRAGILEAMKKRHCYAATDNILLDVRSGEHLMGDEFTTKAEPALQIRVAGTDTVERIDILKDSQIAHTLRPAASEYRGEWSDPKPEGGVHYYYVRVQQKDGQLAWGSPLWINYAK
jgi:hypothetical protein